jgi:hypothetical protein
LKIRLLIPQQITVHGVPRTYQAGDWVEVGRQTAQYMIAEKIADMPHLPKTGLLPRSAGVIGLGDFDVHPTLAHLEKNYQLNTDVGDVGYDVSAEVPYLYTLFWNSEIKLRDELLLPGFGLLRKWWGCYPLLDYETLARDIGDDDARARTEAVIHDLRVPVPNPVLLFVKRNAATKRLLSTWKTERETGDDWRLCFLRALHAVPGLWWPLPYTWGTSDGKDKYDQ